MLHAYLGLRHPPTQPEHMRSLVEPADDPTGALDDSLRPAPREQRRVSVPAASPIHVRNAYGSRAPGKVRETFRL